MIHKAIQSFVCFSILLLPFFGLNQVKGISVELEQHIGWLIPEYSFINQYAISNTYSTAINIKQQSFGQHDFESDFKFPQKGLRLQYSQLGNSSLFGSAISANYFFEAAIYRKGNFKIENRTGIGLGYITRKHDFDSNPQNITIGSHFNIYFHVQFGGSYSFKKWQLSSGIYFDHYSNANMAVPNIGLNNVGIYTAVARKTGPSLAFTDSASIQHSPYWYHQLFVAIGAKHTRTFYDNYFLTSSISYNFGRRVSKWYQLSLGADLFFDSSVKTYLTNNNKSFQPTDYFQTGIHIGNTFCYRKYLFGVEAGYHIGLLNRIHDIQFYSRGYIGYQLTKQLALRLSMKSQVHILDYPELALGWTF